MPSWRKRLLKNNNTQSVVMKDVDGLKPGTGRVDSTNRGSLKQFY
jgi:hypothetical protein